MYYISHAGGLVLKAALKALLPRFVDLLAQVDHPLHRNPTGTIDMVGSKLCAATELKGSRCRITLGGQLGTAAGL